MVIRDRYQLAELLGEGAFGRTFAATDQLTGQGVVVKLIALRGLPGWKPFEYFEREVAVLRSLEHQGVPRFVDAFEAALEGEGPALALVMERIPGQSLLASIQRGHRWTEAKARALLESLLTTLDYLHRLSPPVIHRDIKPGNVMIRPDGRPVLVDFGAVHDFGIRSGHGSLTVVGTAGYMAPEQAMGAPAPVSDLFALGATVIHALSHCHPADLPRRGLRLEFRARLGCSEQVIEVLERLVEPSTEDRYVTAAAALEDLQRPATARPAPQPRPEERRRELVPPSPPTRELARIELPAAPRPMSPTVAEQLRGRASLRNLAAGLVSGAAAAVSAIAITAFDLPLLSFGGVALVMGGALALQRRRSQKRDEELWRNGVAVQARVTAVNREEAPAGWGDRTRVVTTRASYEFKVGYSWHRGDLDASGPFAETVREGDPVLVVYEPGDPFERVAMLVDPAAADEEISARSSA